MIIAKIKGGLGNQLFQYSYARRLALKTGKKLKFDISFYKQQNFRRFFLDKFNTVFDGFINFRERAFLNVTYAFPLFFKDVLYLREGKVVRDLPKISSSKICFVDGYWQSEGYFREISGIIKKELVLKSLDKFDFTLYQKILCSESVSLHFRRGDYVTIPSNKNYNVCDLNYYLRAIDIIGRRIKDCNFFIFSDDLQWVKDNLKMIKSCTFVEGNEEHIDLYLMSLCKHNITANSTFSWWAAWLNDNPDKVVISPKAWRTDEIREELFTDYQVRI